MEPVLLGKESLLLMVVSIISFCAFYIQILIEVRRKVSENRKKMLFIPFYPIFLMVSFFEKKKLILYFVGFLLSIFFIFLFYHIHQRYLFYLDAMMRY